MLVEFDSEDTDLEREAESARKDGARRIGAAAARAASIAAKDARAKDAAARAEGRDATARAAAQDAIARIKKSAWITRSTCGMLNSMMAATLPRWNTGCAQSRRAVAASISVAL